MTKTPVPDLILAAARYMLEGQEILQDFSIPELERIYNGIGPDRFPEKIRDFVTSVNWLFEPAALIHDVEYWIGGTKEYFTAANDRFRRNCYTIVKAEYGWYSPLRYHWLFKAWRFSGYCEEFGYEGFHKTDCECHCTRCQAEAKEKDAEK